MSTLRFAPCAAFFTLSVLCVVAAAQPHPSLYDPDYYGGEDPSGVYLDEPVYDNEFSMGVGYSNVKFNDSEGTPDDLDAFHFEPVLSFAPLPKLAPLRLGAAVGFTISLDDVSGFVSSGGGGVAVIRADTSLMLFEPELRLSWRQPLGSEEKGIFIEPGIAGGGTFAFFDVDNRAFEEAGGTGDPDEWDSTFHGKAFLRLGCRMPGGFGGIEATYLRGGTLEIADDTGGDLEQFYIGIFGALKF